MFDSPFVILSNPTHLLSLSLVKWILDYLPTLLTHHLEAGATLRNNPRENHISIHIKDVFDSAKSDSNSGSVPSQVRLWMWTRNKEYNAKPRKETENEKESRNNKRNKPLLKLALSPPSLASRPHQQLWGLVVSWKSHSVACSPFLSGRTKSVPNPKLNPCKESLVTGWLLFAYHVSNQVKGLGNPHSRI